MCYVSKPLPFRASASVHHFLRVGAFLQAAGSYMGLCWAAHFDDYISMNATRPAQWMLPSAFLFLVFNTVKISWITWRVHSAGWTQWSFWSGSPIGTLTGLDWGRQERTCHWTRGTVCCLGRNAPLVTTGPSLRAGHKARCFDGVRKLGWTATIAALNGRVPSLSNPADPPSRARAEIEFP